MNLVLWLNSLLYASTGIVVLVVTFLIIDWATPGKLWEELLHKNNSALAIVAAGVAIAVGIIIASAIH